MTTVQLSTANITTVDNAANLAIDSAKLILEVMKDKINNDRQLSRERKVQFEKKIDEALRNLCDFNKIYLTEAKHLIDEACVIEKARRISKRRAWKNALKLYAGKCRNIINSFLSELKEFIDQDPSAHSSYTSVYGALFVCGVLGIGCFKWNDKILKLDINEAWSEIRKGGMSTWIIILVTLSIGAIAGCHYMHKQKIQQTEEHNKKLLCSFLLKNFEEVFSNSQNSVSAVELKNIPDSAFDILQISDDTWSDVDMLMSISRIASSELEILAKSP